MTRHGLLTKFPELTVGDQQGTQSAKAVESLLAMALGSTLVDGRVRRAYCIRVEVLCLPDEVLQEVTLVLGEQQVLCLLDNLAGVGNECLTLGRELV